MKLLFDQNLSHKLSKRLQDLFPGSLHVREVGLREADDRSIWEYAKANGFVVVSKDSDFHERSFLLGFPPKVIWLRVGNCPTAMIEQILRDNFTVIVQFELDEAASFLAV